MPCNSCLHAYWRKRVPKQLLKPWKVMLVKLKREFALAFRVIKTNILRRYQHFPWVYAFRLLRASYSLQAGSHVDLHAAIQTYRSVSNTATNQKDYAIHMAASLLEAMAHMKTTTPDAMQNVQSALAKAWTNQTNVGKATQLIGVAHFIQVACSMRQGNPGDMQQKLKEMQSMMDATLRDNSWSMTDDAIPLPINQSPGSALIVSEDTRAILGIGEDGRDNLILSFVGARDVYAIK